MNTKLKGRFIKTYDLHADSIFRFCFFRVSDRDMALDLSQEVFTRYWDSLIKGTAIENDKAFIFMIARNLVIDWYRKKKAVSLEGLMEEMEYPDNVGFVEDSAMKDLELDSEARFLIHKINDLPKSSGQILYLRFVEGFGPKEIAEILNIKAAAASVRIFRALEELKKITGYDRARSQT